MLDHDIIIKKIKDSLNLKGEPKKLGYGSMGVAYYVDGKVYKITSDATEYVNSQKLLGKDFPNIAKIYATYQLKGLEKNHNMANEDFFLIVLEYVNPIKPEYGKALDELNEMLKYYESYHELFSDVDNEFEEYYASVYDGIDDMVMDVAYQNKEIYKIFNQLGIHTDDLFIKDNYGIKNGQLAIFDIGYGNNETYQRDKEHLDLYEGKHFNAVDKYLALFGFKTEDYWGSGYHGDAYFKDDKVLKITGDKEEALIAKKSIDKNFQYLANIKSVVFIKKLNGFGIVMERLDPLPTEVKKAFHSIGHYLGLTYWISKYSHISKNERRDIFNSIKEHFGGDSDEFILFWDLHNLILELDNLGVTNHGVDLHIDNLGIKNGKVAGFDTAGYIKPSDGNELMQSMETLNEVNVLRKLKTLGESEAVKWVIEKLKRLFRKQTDPLERVEIIMSMFLVMAATSLLTANTYRAILGAFNEPDERKELFMGYDKAKRESKTKELKLPQIDVDKLPKPKVSNEVIDKSFDKFLDDLAFRESSGRWDVVNSYGYMGLYQIGKMALKDVAQRSNDPELKNLHNKITPEKFKNNPAIFPPELQDKVIKQLLVNNKHYLRRYTEYIGQEVGGVRVTESGLLAASHLVGNSAVKKFLRTNGETDIADGNGVKASEYLKMFSNYAIDL